MKLSVIVPVYNGEKTIEKCILSILNQSISDFEVIVINDGSVDGTLKVLERLSKIYTSLVVINQSNRGAAMARKAGIIAAKGDYIGFVDADDWIEKDYYEVMIDSAEKTKAEIVCCDYIDENVIHSQNSDKTIVSGEEAFFLLNDRKAVFQFLWNKIFKRDLLQKVFYPKKNMIGEDYTIVLQILRRCKKVSLVKYAGYHYSYMPNSVGRGGFTDSSLSGFYNYIRILKKYKCEDKVHFNSICNYMANEFLWMLIAMGRGHNYQISIVKWIRRYLIYNMYVIISNPHNSMFFKLSSIVAVVNYRMLAPAFNIYLKVYRKI